MSAIEDGAMQDKARQIDDIVKRLNARQHYEYGDNCGALINRDGPEAAAELTRLRERNAELERESREYKGTILHLEAANSRTASLEATVRVLRDALSLAECVYRKNAVAVGEPSSVLDAMQAALASSESVVKSAGEKDGVE